MPDRMQSEKRLYLIRALLMERREDLSVPQEEQAQKRLLRALFKRFFKGYFFITEAQKSAYFTSQKTCCILSLQAGERIRPEAKSKSQRYKQ